MFPPHLAITCNNNNTVQQSAKHTAAHVFNHREEGKSVSNTNITQDTNIVCTANLDMPQIPLLRGTMSSAHTHMIVSCNTSLMQVQCIHDACIPAAMEDALTDYLRVLTFKVREHLMVLVHQHGYYFLCVRLIKAFAGHCKVVQPLALQMIQHTCTRME